MSWTLLLFCTESAASGLRIVIYTVSIATIYARILAWFWFTEGVDLKRASNL